jgi:pilus assembly protein CpaB
VKKYGAVLALVLAVFSGLLAVLLANRWLSSRGSAPTAVRETVPVSKVVIAAQDLQVGARLGAENMTVTDWPKASVPQGAFDNVAAAQGRVVVTRLRAGQPVLASELAAPGSGAGLVAAIKPGKRAIAARVDEVVGVAGFVLPNTFVDVIAVNDARGQNEQRSARTLLQRVEVLAVAQETFTKDGKPQLVKTVTLEVSPQEAEKLALQLNQGQIHLALRNPTDEAMPEPERPPLRIVRASVRPKAEAPAPAPVVAAVPKTPEPAAAAVAPLPFTVEVFRGSAAPERVRFKSVDSEERL